jgi:hypothetical protein
MPLSIEVKEVILRTRFYVRDFENKIPSPEVLLAVNMAKNTIQDVLSEIKPEYWYKSATADAVEDQSKYNLPTDLKVLDRVEVGDNIYMPLSPLEGGNSFSGYHCIAGTEEQSGVLVGIVNLYPAPTASGVASVVFQYICEIPDAMSDTVTWPMPGSVAEIVAIQAAIDIEASRGNVNPGLERMFSSKLEGVKNMRMSRNSGGMKFSTTALRLQ